jgi:hypothetical protein
MDLLSGSVERAQDARVFGADQGSELEPAPRRMRRG